MSRIEEIFARLKRNPPDVRFGDLCLVCEHHFGEARQAGSRHRIYRTPWPGNPRINIQNKKGKAGVHQGRQVLKAVERLELEHAAER
jgi:hypothetical protein